MDENTKIIGYRIRQRRTELGYSQEEVAHLLGLNSKAMISLIEKGRVKPYKHLDRLAEILQTTTEWLCNNEPSEFSPYFTDRDLNKLLECIQRTIEDTIIARKHLASKELKKAADNEIKVLMTLDRKVREQIGESKAAQK